MVVVEAVGLVPQPLAADRVDRVDDGHEVLEELAGDVLVRLVHLRQLERDAEHGGAEEGHPRRAVGLGEVTAGGQRLAPVEHPDVVQTEEASGEEVLPVGILPVHPPGEVEQQLVEDALEERDVPPAPRPGLLVDPPASPGVHGRVHVRERPLVRRQVAVGVHVPFAQEQDELLLGEGRIHLAERQHVEGEVPRGVPRVLPAVGHGEDVAVVEVLRPGGVAALLPLGRRRRAGGISREPLGDAVVVVLLGPVEPGPGLPGDPPLLVAALRRKVPGVERVRLGAPAGEDRVHRGVRLRCRPVLHRRQPHSQAGRAARWKLQPVVRRDLGAGPIRVHRVAPAVHHRLVDGVLRPAAPRRRAEEPLRVGLVVAEQQLGRQVPGRDGPGLEAEQAQRGVPGECVSVLAEELGTGPVALGRPLPRPRVAEPQRGQDVQRRRLRSAVHHGEPHPQVVRRGLRVLHPHVEVAIAVEDAGIEQLVLRQHPSSPPVLLDELGVGERALRVLVERLEVAGGRRGVEEVVQLLHVLAVVALVAVEAVEALLEDGIALVPERHGEAQPALAIGDTQKPVLSPAVGPGARRVMREVAPGLARGGIVLAHGSPLAVREVGTPPLPVLRALAVLQQALRLGIEARGSDTVSVANQHTSEAATGDQRQEPASARGRR